MKPRTIANLVTFLAISGTLVYFGATRFLLPGEQGLTLTMATPNASGLLPRSDVTVRGVPAGSVVLVELQDDGSALVTMALDPGVTITEGTSAEITRRSPIGDITVDLLPGEGERVEGRAHIPASRVSTPPDPVATIEALSEFLGALSGDDLEVVVTELATALRGRGEDLGTIAEAGADLPERILRVRGELETLIRRGPDVLDVLAAEAPTLADDLRLTASLADILRDRRFDLVNLSETTARFAEVFGGLLEDEKANLSCLVSDFADVNDTLASPGNLEDLVAVLELNHFFFGGADQTVQPSSDGLKWFRVHLIPAQEPMGKDYPRNRPRPNILLADACESPFGLGVGATSQPGRPYVAPGSDLTRGQA